MLTFEQIKELIDLVWERELQSVEVERSGFRVKIAGKVPPAPAQAVNGGQPVAQTSGPVASASPQPAVGQAAVPPVDQAEAESKTGPADGLHQLLSPIVGTFYTAPSPDADSYVKVGDRVKRGQVLCIVEAMKLMNEIESDEDGLVEIIYPKNAQPVEYGEPLFAIRPD